MTPVATGVNIGTPPVSSTPKRTCSSQATIWRIHRDAFQVRCRTSQCGLLQPTSGTYRREFRSRSPSLKKNLTNRQLQEPVFCRCDATDPHMLNPFYIRTTLKYFENFYHVQKMLTLSFGENSKYPWLSLFELQCFRYGKILRRHRPLEWVFIRTWL